MTESSSKASFRALLLLRVGVAVLLGVHGFSRAIKGDVPGFGNYLGSVGFPFPLALAWAITAGEMVGVSCLALGRFVRWVIPGHLLVLVMGIYLVHGREGWFVVGGGRNGVEYSVLLIISLAALWWAEPDRVRIAGA